MIRAQSAPDPTEGLVNARSEGKQVVARGGDRKVAAMQVGNLQGLPDS